MSISNVDVDIFINGKAITTYKHEGNTYVEGRPGSTYEIKIYNNSLKRVEAVVSVDGLSVIDGTSASELSKGYIINPCSSITIDGWRFNAAQVAEFKFGDKKDSYTNKLGNGTVNTGVIGVMVFNERYVSFTRDPNIVWRDYVFPKEQPNIKPYYNTSYGVGNISLQQPQHTHTVNNIGTEFGGTLKPSYVTNTTFARVSNNPDNVGVIYYDSRRGLEARGIVVDTRKILPDPFPNSTYCKRV